MKDLGTLDWPQVTSVPVLPARAAPLTGAIRFRARTFVAPEGSIVHAVPGHMYVLHVKDEGADYYVMFRVEEVTPAGECRMSWKRVPSPEKK